MPVTMPRNPLQVREALYPSDPARHWRPVVLLLVVLVISSSERIT